MSFKLLLIATLLTTCGFTPVYGPSGTGNALQNRIEVSEPKGRNDQLLMQQLERRLGRPTNAAYALDIDLTVSEEGLAIDAEGDITRYNLVGTAAYTLTDATSGTILTTGTVSNFTGYSATGTTVATLAAEEDANQRLMVILGDMVTDRLLTLKL